MSEKKKLSAIEKNKQYDLQIKKLQEKKKANQINVILEEKDKRISELEKKLSEQNSNEMIDKLQNELQKYKSDCENYLKIFRIYDIEKYLKSNNLSFEICKTMSEENIKNILISNQNR